MPTPPHDAPPLYINARFLTQPLSGTQRYAEQLLNVLDARVAGRGDMPHIIALLPEGDFRRPSWSNIELRQLGPHSGHLWEQVTLARAARDGWLLSLISSGPILHPRHIVTFHDAAIFDQAQNFSWKYGIVHRAIRPRLARRARRICTVSEFSRGRLSETLGIARDRFVVIPNGGDHLRRIDSDTGAIARRALTPRGYILYVGNEAPHKNVATALDAFNRLDRAGLSFVTVGIGRSSVFGEVAAMEGRSVRRLHDVDDAELRALYENAAMLVFPSRYEGFGIPPVEAMSLGCPVVASNAASIPEVVRDAALLVDPEDADAMAAAFARILDMPGQREEMVARGTERAALFTWDEAGRKLEELIITLIAENERKRA